jgi:hypothetical protein
MIMNTIKLAIPKFFKGQEVKFIGGVGTILDCHPNSGSWSYIVEMQMGQEPEMGRIGCETTILLFETDMVTDNYKFV